MGNAGTRDQQQSGKPMNLLIKNGAGEGNRTLVCSLGSCRSAIELRPQIIQQNQVLFFIFSLIFFTHHCVIVMSVADRNAAFYRPLQRRAASKHI